MTSIGRIGVPCPIPWHVATAAEAFAAGQFAKLGWEVSAQYGANQPEYDLIVVKGDRMLKISVKGSKDGPWGLTLSYKKGADYHGAREDELPRMYLATPAEIAQRLKESAGGRGDTILYEHHVWSQRAAGPGTVDRIPEYWRLTATRIEEVWKKVTSLGRGSL